MKYLICIACLLYGSPLPAASLHAGAGQPWPTIRAALAAARAGDTVFVHPGTYTEGNLVVDKALALLGLDYPVLDGQHQGEIITVTASDVTIRGFEIRNSGQLSTVDIAGIKVLSADRVTVEGNRLRDCNFGIYLSNTNDCRVAGNDVQGIIKEEQNSGNGIHLWKGARALVEGNRLSGHRDGIYFEFVTDSEIRSNHSEGNLRYGLHFMFSHNDHYHHNRFLRNGADAQGVVVDLNRYVTRGSDGTSARSVQPVVAFDLPDGRQVTFEDALGTSWEPYELGAVVPVKYDPGDPEDARIVDSSFRASGGNAVFLLFGGAFSLIGLLCVVFGLVL